MPVPPIAVLKFLVIARNPSGWPSLKVDIFILYVSDVACEGFLKTLNLMMCVVCSSSVFTLMREIGGGYIRA